MLCGGGDGSSCIPKGIRGPDTEALHDDLAFKARDAGGSAWL